MRVARLAFAYRQAFHKDVVIDMVCYRRHGHNEGDDPSYTQPLMYKRIDARRSVRKLYTEALVKRGDISIEEAEAALDDFQRRLQVALDETRSQAHPPGGQSGPGAHRSVGVLPHVDTGVPSEALDEIFAALDHVPEGFTVHPKLAKQFDARDKMYVEDGEVDWALGEALAFGSLLHEGTSVRSAGQDSRRGTFSHRHAVLVDYETGAESCPLERAARDGAKFWIYDSLLSASSRPSGFEYGYSVENKDALVVWEAQFGDFVNGAQIIIDQFIVAAEDKWDQTSGLVLLLPHGYEGQGPEHSSARIERFLTLAAEDNIQVCNATTAAQYFHLLRRQMHREVRKPLVIFTPKSLSAGQDHPVADRLPGGRFVPGGPRRPGRHRSGVGPAGRVRLRQGRRGGPGRTGQARRAGRRRPGRAALPVALRRGRPRAVPVPERRARSSGCRRSPRTWVPGTTSRAGSTRPTRTPTRSAG